MSVSQRVRQIEAEVDADIQAMPIWRGSRDDVLTDIVAAYRDVIEVVFRLGLDARIFGRSQEEFGGIFLYEDRLRAGVLWALKWALEFCPDRGVPASAPSDLADLIFLGGTYEAFVDALKHAEPGLAEIQVDEASRTISCFEGEQASEWDGDIVRKQRLTPTRPHRSLTDDGDLLTSRWTAGDYRRLTKKLADHGAGLEHRIVFAPSAAKAIGASEISVPQPTIAWLARPENSPDREVFDDLVIPARVTNEVRWKLVSLLDNPIIPIGGRYCALSSDLKTIAAMDDHMLRLAARVDQRSYNLASTLREDRMIKLCTRQLRQSSPPWEVRSRVRLRDPDREADILATRNAQRIVIQLKSTLRPETPWEVVKRNEDLVGGIKHTRSLLDRGIADLGFVVTDGYRGDFACWAEAIAAGVPIGTLDDINLIAGDPASAGTSLSAEIGVFSRPPKPRDSLPDRESDLVGWKLRLVDGSAATRDA